MIFFAAVFAGIPLHPSSGLRLSVRLNERQCALLLYFIEGFIIRGMNWLILSTSKDNVNDVKDVKELILSHFPVSGMYDAPDDEEKMRFLHDIIPAITHCVIFAPEAPHSRSLSFILGFLSGKKLPIYSVAQTGIETLVRHSFVQAFNSRDELFQFLRADAKAIAKAHSVREARDYLNAHGIPLAAQNFALAVENGDQSLCTCFYTAGIDVNARDSLGTPMLNVAARADKLEMVNWLLERGADINAVSEDRGYTALMDAVWRGNEEITRTLTERGAELNTVNKEGQTNLVLAVGADRVEICRILAEHGANPDIPDSMGMSAYGYANLFKKKEIVAILEKYHKESGDT